MTMIGDLTPKKVIFLLGVLALLGLGVLYFYDQQGPSGGEAAPSQPFLQPEAMPPGGSTSSIPATPAPEIPTDQDTALHEMTWSQIFDWAKEEPMIALLLGCLAIIAILLLLAIFIHITIPKCPNCHRMTVKRSGQKILRKATPQESGLGESVSRCTSCGHAVKKTWVIPYYVDDVDINFGRRHSLLWVILRIVDKLRKQP